MIAHSTRERLIRLGRELTLYVMSADTYGTLDHVIGGLPLRAQRTVQPLSCEKKLAFLLSLDAAQTVAVGNGCNDVGMLATAALGIAITGPEGCAREAWESADIVFAQIDDALDSLLVPRRLMATLRG